MIVSLAQAAELTGKSRQTIYRRARKGELAITKLGDNSKGVDISELERVFGPITVQEAEVANVTVEEMDTSERANQPEVADLTELETELANAKAIIQKHEERFAELQTDQSKLWDQLATQRLLLAQTEQATKSIPVQKTGRSFRFSTDAAVFLLVGSSIAAMTFILSNVL